MVDIAASVLTRLKNKAAESGRSYQLCLQLFCQEEFLRRLEKSKYAENLVLKGGLFIYSITDFDGATLTEALRKTFENRGHTFTVEQFEQVMAFDGDDAMQKKWKAFVRKIDTKTDDYGTVLRTIKAFLIKPFEAAVANSNLSECWLSSANKWQ